VRYARFAPPQKIKPAKGDTQVTVPLAFQPEDAWWDSLRDAANLRKGRVLIYVHGYRETLQTTARDAVQIGAMSNFDGPIIHYSWPSQGNLLSYAVDETNMYWDQRNFRNFLTKLARTEWVKEIVLVSHSLGARLVIPAVEYVDRTSTNADSSNISNIILASPDVDREDFERDIAEEVLAARRVNNDRRVTVYASLNDRALAVSRALHGYPRLGSPYCFNPFEAQELKAKGLPQRCFATKTTYQTEPAKTGFTIIDTTDLSGGGAGHSDYLRSFAVCKDFAAVVNGARMTEDRVATKDAHVFTLRPPVKPTKEDIAAMCKRLPD
jgi:esterase/lipase superfamily enzyme